MDRLICGDVGFGKTEVAIRAAFKVVTAGKQVAVLCPTTVLAAQHLTTFTERLAAYPFNIELLSRFRSKAEQAKTVEGLKDGTVDIVVGTHRLLSKDVKFKNLGMMIVDEEQRFGVAHKERLKQLRTRSTCLRCPPRRFRVPCRMALSGLRDMSVIEDPPEGRMPCSPTSSEYDDDLVRDAILRELRARRPGLLRPQPMEIDLTMSWSTLQELVPDARIRLGPRADVGGRAGEASCSTSTTS